MALLSDPGYATLRNKIIIPNTDKPHSDVGL